MPAVNHRLGTCPRGTVDSANDIRPISRLLGGLAQNTGEKRPLSAAAEYPSTPVTRVIWPLSVPGACASQDGEGDPIVFGGGFEVRADVLAGDCDRAAESLGGGECLGHGGRQRTPLAAMAILKKGHRPGQLA